MPTVPVVLSVSSVVAMPFVPSAVFRVVGALFRILASGISLSARAARIAQFTVAVAAGAVVIHLEIHFRHLVSSFLS